MMKNMRISPLRNTKKKGEKIMVKMFNMKEMPPALQTYDLCLAAVKEDGEQFEYVDERFRTSQRTHD